MTYDLRSIRPLGKESLRGLKPAELASELPAIEWVDPKSLFIEEAYQREVGERGTGLIRKIYSRFDWALYKLPSCIRHESGVLVCIDGQHTAIAAASHPGLEKIPVLVVAVVSAAHRAAAFVGHNTERIALTPMAILRAEIAAGDALAKAIDAGCRDAGVTILPNAVNIRKTHPVGSTIAVGTIRSVVKRHGRGLLTQVLRLLKRAERGPIKAGEISAVAAIMADEGAPPEDDLLRVIASKTAEQWAAIAATAAADDGNGIVEATVAAWCRELRVRLTGDVSRETSRPFRAPAREATKPEPRLPVAPKPEKRASEAPAARPPPIQGRGDRPKAPVPAPRSPSPLRPRSASPPVRNLQPLVASKQLPGPHLEPSPRNSAPPPERPLPPAKPTELFERGGIRIDLRTRALLHRGRTATLPAPDYVRLVAALAGAMPEMVDWLFVCRKIYGRDPDGSNRVRNMLPMLNAILGRVSLTVKTAEPCVGLRLIDLDAKSSPVPA